VLGFIGTFGKWHGVDVLARAIAELVALDSDWLTKNRVRFLLVGDGLKASEVDEILKAERRCASFVVRTGLVPQGEAPAYLALADVLVSPHVPNSDGSRFFGSPTKLFEYMAMGKAILASDLDQIGEVLQPSLRVTAPPTTLPPANTPELALLAEAGSVDQLVRGIRLLIDRPEWRLALGANARSRALERYTWRHHVGAILDGLHASVRSGRS
jgi:glycosyltransferase involved in cell wall biosynthesis